MSTFCPLTFFYTSCLPNCHGLGMTLQDITVLLSHLPVGDKKQRLWVEIRAICWKQQWGMKRSSNSNDIITKVYQERVIYMQKMLTKPRSMKNGGGQALHDWLQAMQLLLGSGRAPFSCPWHKMLSDNTVITWPCPQGSRLQPIMPPHPVLGWNEDIHSTDVAIRQKYSKQDALWKSTDSSIWFLVQVLLRYT